MSAFPKILLATVCVAALASAPAFAQTPGAGEIPQATPTQGSRTTVYDAGFVGQYPLLSTLDIVERIPVFTLDLGNSASATGVDVRGFAGTAGNVVINGARPSTKSETLNTTLQRIPAQRVVRVELGPGDLYGSDYAGKSQVLNILLSDAAGFDANVTANATRRYTGYIQ